MGSTGPIEVGKNVLPVCIAGCTYTIIDNATTKFISASFSSKACNAYQAYIEHNGTSAPCFPGGDAINVIPRVDGTWAGVGQTVASGNLFSQNTSMQSVSLVHINTLHAQDSATSISPAHQMPAIDTTSPSPCDEQGVSFLLGAPCGGADPTSGTQEGESGFGQSPHQPSIEKLIRDTEVPEQASSSQSPPVVDSRHGLSIQGVLGTIENPSLHTEVTNKPISVGITYEGDVTEPSVYSNQSEKPATSDTWIDVIINYIRLLFTSPRVSFSSESLMAQAVRAPIANPRGDTAICNGGTVFVYSKDFSGMSEDPNRLAKLEAVHCYQPIYDQRGVFDWGVHSHPFRLQNGFRQEASLVYKRSGVQSLPEVCRLLPVPSRCAVMYVATIPIGEGSLKKEPCTPAVVERGTTINFSMCATIEANIRSTYQNQTTRTLDKLMEMQREGWFPSILTPYNSGAGPRINPNGTVPMVPNSSDMEPKMWGLRWTIPF